MATKESVTQLIDKVYTLADTEELEVDLVPIRLTGGDTKKGKGGKEFVVLSFQAVLDADSFHGGLHFMFDQQTRIFGAGLAIPKKYLKHHEGESRQAPQEPAPEKPAVGDQTVLHLL